MKRISRINMSRIKSGFIVIIFIFIGLAPGCKRYSNISPDDSSFYPKYIIIMIGDGMGFEQIKACSIYLYGQPGFSSLEAFPYSGEITTYSANNNITDSAAAATAIATGRKVNNGVISLAMPGDGSELVTLLEHFKDEGMSTGLVTTTFMTHATPAAFGAHEPNRSNYNEIAEDYLYQTRPNLLFGGGGYGMTVEEAENAGYTVVTNFEEMSALQTETIDYVSGQFGTTNLPYEYDGLGNLPHLYEMTATAIDILDNNPNGFFLMIEGGRIDHACHDNDISRAVFELIAFSQAVEFVHDWAQDHINAQILVTADHETGGLVVEANNGAGNFPTVTWLTGSHTESNVPYFTCGINDSSLDVVLDNTDIFDIITLGY